MDSLKQLSTNLPLFGRLSQLPSANPPLFACCGTSLDLKSDECDLKKPSVLLLLFGCKSLHFGLNLREIRALKTTLEPLLFCVGSVDYYSLDMH